MEENRHMFYPAEEIVELVRSLDRPQDEGLFSKDVLLVYPHLAEEYTRVCPRRCDLATVAEKAANGDYSYDVKLTPLRDDIELMVNNCLRFNGRKGPLAEIANRFETFAKMQIDAYVTKKTGGRRVSSFRLSTTAAGELTRGKRQREEAKSMSGTNSPLPSQPSQSQPPRGGSRSSHTGTAEVAAVTNAEIVKLVESLNRREDKGAFAVDVATAYPELKQSYEEVCPEKMNLIIAKERAESGYYLGQQQTSSKRRQVSTTEASMSSVFGSTVAESLLLLRNDVELMVSNCLRFNANAHAWVKLAKSFHHFAHKKIDDFVLRHAPALKGTKSGVDAYINEADQPSQLLQLHTQSPQKTMSSVSQSQQIRLSSSQDNERTVESTPPTVAASTSAYTKKGTATAAATAAVSIPPRAPAAAVVKYATPTVVPTALQPVFATPDALRRRMVSDHLHRGTLRARLIRASAAGGDDVVDTTDTADNKKDNNSNHNNAQGEQKEKENDEEAGDKTKREETQNSETQRIFGPAFSCRAVLRAFAVSVRDFYRSQRERQEFATPFEYPQQEEQLYVDCIGLIEQQFEQLFLHMLLYDQEKADCYEWSAEKAVRKLVHNSETVPPTSNTPSVAAPGSGTSWLDDVHLCYLVRFLQHFPQLMGLACATPVPSTAATKANSTLHITEVAKGIVEKLARITEELLTFIAQYEEKVVGASL